MATATAQSQVASIRSERKASALNVYVENVNRLAADKPMGVEGAELLADAMEKLGLDAETLTADVQCVLSAKYQTIAQFDHAKDDTEREKFFAFLKARADRREHERLHPVAPRSKAIPITPENCEAIQRDNDKRIAMLDSIRKWLNEEIALINRAGDPGQRPELQYRVNEAIRLVAERRDFENANPRLFRGAVEDRRPAWDWQTVCEKRAEQRRGGIAGIELAPHTALEERLAWRPDGETTPPANSNYDFHRMVLNKPRS